MKKEMILAMIMVFSWTAATLFTTGVDDMITKYTEDKHNKAMIYFGLSLLFIFIVASFSDITATARGGSTSSSK